MILNEKKKKDSERNLDSEALGVKLKALVQKEGLRNEGRVRGRAMCHIVDTNSLYAHVPPHNPPYTYRGQPISFPVGWEENTQQLG